MRTWVKNSPRQFPMSYFHPAKPFLLDQQHFPLLIDNKATYTCTNTQSEDS